MLGAALFSSLLARACPQLGRLFLRSLKDRAGLGCVAADLAAELLQTTEFGLAAQALHRFNTQLPPLQLQALAAAIDQFDKLESVVVRPGDRRQFAGGRRRRWR